jgi:hypothetical protein
MAALKQETQRMMLEIIGSYGRFFRTWRRDYFEDAKV